MSISYEAHPLNHGGEPDVTVEFKVPNGMAPDEYRALLATTETEVQRRERIAGIVPLERVVFTAHDSAHPHAS